MAEFVSNLVTSATQNFPLLNKINICGNPTVSPVATVEMSSIIRIAGLSGAIAISLGAYGSHVVRQNEQISERRKNAFETGSRYHLIHSVALLAATKSRFPLITSTLLIVGISLFCGPCYHYSISGEESTQKVTPIGGVTLILGWLSFVL